MRVFVTTVITKETLHHGATESGLAGEALERFSRSPKTLEVEYKVDADGHCEIVSVNRQPLLHLKGKA